MWVDSSLDAVYLCWITTFAFWFSAWNYKTTKQHIYGSHLEWFGFRPCEIRIQWNINSYSETSHVGCNLVFDKCMDTQKSKDTKCVAQLCPRPDPTQSCPFHVL